MSDLSSTFRWWSIGGLGEVGMNCMVFDFGGQVVPVDAGVIFADTNNFGIEALFPDYATLLTEHQPKHWLITHAHEDHIGAVAAVFEQCHRLNIEAPIFLAPPFAAALILQKLQDFKLFPNASRFSDRVQVIEPGASFESEQLRVQFVPTRHSTVETCSLAFQWNSPQGPLHIFHTADFKLDLFSYPDGVVSYDRQTLFGQKPVDIVLIDSTNSERNGHSVAEKDIVPGLEKLIAEATGRVYLSLFASNVYRMAEVLALASKYQRKACLAGTSLSKAHQIAGNLGIYKKSCPNFSDTVLLEASELAKLPRQNQLILCTGSQGEPRSILRRVADQAHPDLILEKEDCVIFSSKLIPGNERRVYRMINALLRAGAIVHHGEKGKERAGGPIHASGHARREEIEKVLEIFQPRHIIPVHGELRQLMACADIARDMMRQWQDPLSNIHTCEDSTRLVFEHTHQGWTLVDRQLMPPTERYLRFDHFIARSSEDFLRTRKKMAKGGAVSVVIDSAGRVDCQIQGLFPETWTSPALLPKLHKQIENWAVQVYRHAQASGEFPIQDIQVLQDLRNDLERNIRRWTGSRPAVFLHNLQL